MIKRRANSIGVPETIDDRADGNSLEKVQKVANHATVGATKLHTRTKNPVTGAKVNCIEI